MDDDLILWRSDAPQSEATVEWIEHFDARGMRRVYGRGDWFGRHHSFNMEIWLAHDGHLLMRCWSRCGEIDGRSFCITGIDLSKTAKRRMHDPHQDGWAGFDDAWVPAAVRHAYEQWVTDEF